MYFLNYDRYNLRKSLKKILKKNEHFFDNYNIIYINKSPNKKTNVYTALDVLEEFLGNKIFEIIDLLDENNYYNIYLKLKEKFKNYNNNNVYIILNNENITDFKYKFFKYLNNIPGINLIEKKKFYDLFNKIEIIIE